MPSEDFIDAHILQGLSSLAGRAGVILISGQTARTVLPISFQLFFLLSYTSQIST